MEGTERSHCTMMPFGRGPKFCPAGSVRYLNKHSSMNSFSKSGLVGRSIEAKLLLWTFLLNKVNKFSYVISGDLFDWFRR